MVRKRTPAKPSTTAAAAADLRAQAADLARTPLVAAPDPEDEKDAAEAELDATEVTFDFKHVDRRGNTHEGVFTNRILTVGEQQAAAATAARLAGGLPFESLDPGSAALNDAIAHMALSFTDAKTGDFRGPSWAQDLRTLYEQEIILELWKKVVAHERRFFRLDEVAESGQEPAE